MRAPALALLLLAGCGVPSHEQSDWEKRNVQVTDFTEEVPALPAPPRRDTLIEFLAPEGGFKFHVDGATLDAGKDGVVRYVLVARSPTGTETVTFEGMRCATAEIRRYAVGRPDGSWGGRPGPWTPVQTPWHRVLAREHFCPGGPIRDQAEGVRSLRGGR